MKLSRIDIIGSNGNDAEVYHHLHKHGHRPKSGASPTYTTWMSMRARCNSPSADSYPQYGGKGVKVCERWEDFVCFLADMGERPDGCTIDRIDPGKGYEPGNCRWATSREQALNRRNVTFTEVEGETLCLHDIAKKYGVPMTTLARRYEQGIRGKELISRTNRNVLRVGSQAASSKLTEAQVAVIKRELKAGTKSVVLARRYGVSGPVISDIKCGKSWLHVEPAYMEGADHGYLCGEAWLESGSPFVEREASDASGSDRLQVAIPEQGHEGQASELGTRGAGQAGTGDARACVGSATEEG